MIKTFRDEYAFLSNFTLLEKPYVYQKISYPTIEHFYQAMKTKDKRVRLDIANHPLKGLKGYAKSVTALREDWEDIKVRVLITGTRYKYSEANPTLRKKLLDTGNQPIQEGNYWGDTYWGVSLKDGKGLNTLGRILMEMREYIIKNS